MAVFSKNALMSPCGHERGLSRAVPFGAARLGFTSAGRPPSRPVSTIEQRAAAARDAAVGTGDDQRCTFGAASCSAETVEPRSWRRAGVPTTTARAASSARSPGPELWASTAPGSRRPHRCRAAAGGAGHSDRAALMPVPHRGEPCSSCTSIWKARPGQPTLLLGAHEGQRRRRCSKKTVAALSLQPPISVTYSASGQAGVQLLYACIGARRARVSPADMSIDNIAARRGADAFVTASRVPRAAGDRAVRALRLRRVRSGCGERSSVAASSPRRRSARRSVLDVATSQSRARAARSGRSWRDDAVEVPADVRGAARPAAARGRTYSKRCSASASARSKCRACSSRPLPALSHASTCILDARGHQVTVGGLLAVVRAMPARRRGWRREVERATGVGQETVTSPALSGRAARLSQSGRRLERRAGLEQAFAGVLRGAQGVTCLALTSSMPVLVWLAGDDAPGRRTSSGHAGQGREDRALALVERRRI